MRAKILKYLCLYAKHLKQMGCMYPMQSLHLFGTDVLISGHALCDENAQSLNLIAGDKLMCEFYES